MPFSREFENSKMRLKKLSIKSMKFKRILTFACYSVLRR